MRSLAVAFCLTVVAVSGLFAQSDRGTITGTVADPAGAVVAGAQVQARNIETGVVFDSVSSATGNYTIGQLPVGTYEIAITVQGFKKYVRTGITIQVAQVLRVDAALEVGAATESVTVNETAPLLDTETGDLRHTVEAAGMNDLPILGIGASQAGSAGIRNPYAMVELIPGTMWQANANVRVNGAPNNTQSFRIEGQDASNSGTPGVPAQTQPSVDAIQEVSIQTSNYAAEYGQVGGGYFNVTMKGGTNQFHGTAYDYFVNEAFNAGNPFTDAPAGTGNPRPRNRRNDYGFTVGGPAWIPKVYNGHDKTFFFFNFEQYREAVAINNQLETVPTAAYEAGNFATATPTGAGPIGTDPLGRSIFQGEIYDPGTQRTASTGQIIRDPFPNQQIPLSRFDPVAAKIQSLFPAPVGPSASGVVNNYVPNIPTTRVTEIPSVKIDQVLGKGKLSFFWQRTKTTAPLSFTFGQVDGLPDPIATNVGTFQNAPVYRLNYDYSLTPTLLLHLGGGYRSNYFFTPSVNEEGALPNYNAQTQLGLNGGTSHTFFPAISGLCTGAGGFTPYSCTGQGGMQNIGGEARGYAITQAPSFNTSLTWVKGNHTFKYGAEFRIEGYPAPSISGTEGTYTFAADQTSLPYLNGTTLLGQTPGFGYASFLLGAVKTISINNPVDPRLGKSELGMYVQDSWKITRRLTFDYGLRYDYSTYLKDGRGREPDFSVSTPNPAVGNILGAFTFDGSGTGHCNCNIAKNYPLAFGPRFGIAYQITSKTVFRTGFGIIIGNTEANNNSAGGLAGSSNTVSAPGGFGSTATTLAVGIPSSFNPPPWPNLNPGQFNTTPAPIAAPEPLIDANSGRPPRQYQWSAGIQRELMRNMVVEASYVGNRGIWWQAPGLLNLNQIPLSRLASVGLSPASPLLTDTLSNPAVIAAGFGGLPYPGFPTTQTLAQALRPFPQFTTVNAYWDPLGDSWYEALQVKATKRVSHGLTFLSTFSYQKTLVSGSEIGEPNPATSGGAVTNDVFNRKNNKYISAYDQPFLFNISATYTTPKATNNKMVSFVTRDWNIGAFLQYASGFPIEVPYANNNLSSSLFANGSGSTTGTFANRVPGQPLYTVDLNCHCYDPNKTFVLNPAAWVNPPAGQFGTSAAYYSDYRQQRRPSENMNLGRTWRMKERMSLAIRFELTNVFNRAYWGNPTNTNAQMTQTRTATGATAGNAASGFGWMNALTPGFTGASVPRNGVLVARFSF
ncbi:MAG TPA: TonB-dependent receptor [Bryobacteraceae bacterium]|nr:TonB-dependent receptor [Bryobacteraceae bacterium]